MSLDACAELVAKGDPDRFAATMTAPPEMRAKLLPLYAFNLEVARAPWVTEEPMIAQMRLQWWTDAVAEIYQGGQVRKHEVVTPLAELIAQTDLDRGRLDGLIRARHLDIAGEGVPDLEAMIEYLEATSGSLMALAAEAATADPPAVSAAVDFGMGAGSASLLVALPALKAAGRMPMAGDPAETAELLRGFGHQFLDYGRKARAAVPRSLMPVFLCGWQADYILDRAKDPKNVWNGDLLPSEFRRRATLAWRAMTGRW